MRRQKKNYSERKVIAEVVSLRNSAPWDGVNIRLINAGRDADPRYFAIRAMPFNSSNPLWHHEMDTFSALLILCAGNSPVTGEFPSQRPVTQMFDVLFDLRLNKWLSKQSRRRWFETPSRSLWRPCDVTQVAAMPCVYIPFVAANYHIRVWTKRLIFCRSI